MKKIIYFIYAIIIITSLSCSNAKNSKIKQKIKTPQLSINIQHINIPISDSALNKYYITSSYKIKSGNIYWGYNGEYNSIDLFNQKELLDHIFIKRDDVNSVQGRPVSINIKSKDSIWVYDRFSFNLLDHSGKVYLKIPANLNAICEHSYSMRIADFRYDKENNTLIYPIKENDKYYLAIYKLPINKLIKKIALYFPPSNPEGKYNYSHLTNPNVSFNDNYAIYNYPYDEHVFVVNIKTGKQNINSGLTTYFPEFDENFDLSKEYKDWFYFDLMHYHFFNLMYIKKYDIYARLCLSNSKIEDKDNIPNQVVDEKTIYITFFNSKFKIIGEVKLPKNTYDNFTGWGAMYNGIYI